MEAYSQIILASRPKGLPAPSNFRLKPARFQPPPTARFYSKQPICLSTPTCGDG